MKNRKKIHDDWETPKELYNKLNEEFNFRFDPCPIKPSFDGLKVEWANSNFINPPYERSLKEAFIRKAFEESKKGNLCVMLLPVSTSTKIFHEIIYPNAEIRFLKGRVKFKGTNTKGEYVYDKTGQHDSMLVIFHPKKKEKLRIDLRTFNSGKKVGKEQALKNIYLIRFRADKKGCYAYFPKCLVNKEIKIELIEDKKYTEPCLNEEEKENA